MERFRETRSRAREVSRLCDRTRVRDATPRHVRLAHAGDAPPSAYVERHSARSALRARRELPEARDRYARVSERRAIFITGAASGMGLATARLFGRQGWFVGAVDLSHAGLEKLGNELPPERLFAARLDVRDRNAYARIVDDFGRA